MIKIEIVTAESGKICGFHVHGHSGTAKRGRDIVCAGVSAVTQTALLGILTHLRREADYSVKDGDLRMSLKNPPDELTEAVLQTMVLGLREMVDVYKDSVTMTNRTAH